jgi:predicted membrane protein
MNNLTTICLAILLGICAILLIGKIMFHLLALIFWVMIICILAYGLYKVVSNNSRKSV